MIKAEQSRHEAGFTLLELMTVIAVASILMVIALPIYFDYAARTKVSEGVNRLGSITSQIAEAYYTNGSFPADNSEAGLGVPGSYASDYVTGITVTAGGVATAELSVSELGANNLVSFTPSYTGTGIEWECSSPASNGVEDRFLPANCR
jgi:type IV pilus assembly protein PilA